MSSKSEITKTLDASREELITKQPAFWVMCAAEQAVGRDDNGHKLEGHKTAARRDHRAHMSLSDNLCLLTKLLIASQTAVKTVVEGPRGQARVCGV